VSYWRLPRRPRHRESGLTTTWPCSLHGISRSSKPLTSYNRDGEYFDYESVAREAGLTTDQLRRLKELVRADYPDDDMLFELHVLRACNAIRDGSITFEQAIGEPAQK
jgi:hypothetical protein